MSEYPILRRLIEMDGAYWWKLCDIAPEIEELLSERDGLVKTLNVQEVYVEYLKGEAKKERAGLRAVNIVLEAMRVERDELEHQRNDLRLQCEAHQLTIARLIKALAEKEEKPGVVHYWGPHLLGSKEAWYKEMGLKPRPCACDVLPCTCGALSAWEKSGRTGWELEEKKEEAK